MAQANDKGHDALAGFLYQNLGSARLAAEVLGQPSDSEAGISATFTIVELERHGQDANFVSTEGGVPRARQLVQFKYSGTPAKHPIEPHDLIEILEGFRESEESADEIQAIPTTFRLVSNRQVTDSTRNVVEAGNNGLQCEQLDAVEEFHNGEKRHKGRTKAKNTDYRRILKRLSIELVDEQDCCQVIARRARAFGMLDSELPDGVTRLIGTFFGRAASVANRRITLPELDCNLVGFRDPRRLDDSALRPLLLDGITATKHSLQLPRLGLLPREELQNPIISSRALVIVSGEGGTGKSVAACQIIEATVLSAEEAPPPFAAIESVYDVRPSWIAELVANWRNSTEVAHHNEPPDMAIMRLVTATSAAPPILQLALDGIDEVGPTPEFHAVGQILRFFHREDERCRNEHRSPRAVLVVTCRDPEDVYSEWIYHGGFPSGADYGNVLRLTRFSDAQLRDLADRVLPRDLASRIQFTAALAAIPAFRAGKEAPFTAGDVDLPSSVVASPEVQEAFRVSPSSLEAAHSSRDRPDSVAPDVFEALKHPTLWRVFSEDLVGEEEQHRVLDGETIALGGFCRAFVEWLCSKAERRRSAIPRDMTRAMLRAVASEFDNPQRAGKLDKDWIQPAVAVTGCARFAAEQVFREVESLGLVVKVDKERWKWRHPFMCEHLAGLEV